MVQPLVPETFLDRRYVSRADLGLHQVIPSFFSVRRQGDYSSKLLKLYHTMPAGDGKCCLSYMCSAIPLGGRTCCAYERTTKHSVSQHLALASSHMIMPTSYLTSSCTMWSTSHAEILA
ncbi:predicted protein [Histoplasma mississippiense (nom. inval.)]|uniref:predicted protein n=1 Tax=Ajellomyces capsulatus (strain NAm1 / WU24) TaxID=2059318 RepID=UPI000157C2B6|nr:predicted protein [Histoplasma mississippiense (nom. inval.)]EDN07871.1 predicted protein [Histoplasma mississippiense (nom. inval.)]